MYSNVSFSYYEDGCLKDFKLELKEEEIEMEEARCTKISKKTFISKNKLQKTCKSCCLVKQKKYKFRIREEASVFTPFLHHFYTCRAHPYQYQYFTIPSSVVQQKISLRVCVSLSPIFLLFKANLQGFVGSSSVTLSKERERYLRLVWHQEGGGSGSK